MLDEMDLKILDILQTDCTLPVAEMGKAVGLVMNCDKMVGEKFEQGFANLNAVVAAPAKH